MEASNDIITYVWESSSSNSKGNNSKSPSNREQSMEVPDGFRRVNYNSSPEGSDRSLNDGVKNHGNHANVFK